MLHADTKINIVDLELQSFNNLYTYDKSLSKKWMQVQLKNSCTTTKVSLATRYHMHADTKINIVGLGLQRYTF